MIQFLVRTSSFLFLEFISFQEQFVYFTPAAVCDRKRHLCVYLHLLRPI